MSIYTVRLPAFEEYPECKKALQIISLTMVLVCSNLSPPYLHHCVDVAYLTIYVFPIKTTILRKDQTSPIPPNEHNLGSKTCISTLELFLHMYSKKIL